MQKYKHAFAVLCELLGGSDLTKDLWIQALGRTARIQDFVCEQVYQSRQKDYDNPFRQATFRNTEEMIAAIGTIEDNSFVKQVRMETEQFKQTLEEIARRG